MAKPRRKSRKVTFSHYCLTKFVCEDTRRIFYDWKLTEFPKPKKKRGRRRRLVKSHFPKEGK